MRNSFGEIGPNDERTVIKRAISSQHRIMARLRIITTIKTLGQEYQKAI